VFDRRFDGLKAGECRGRWRWSEGMLEYVMINYKFTVRLGWHFRWHPGATAVDADRFSSEVVAQWFGGLPAYKQNKGRKES
jgi:hypothetical protein